MTLADRGGDRSYRVTQAAIRIIDLKRPPQSFGKMFVRG